MFVGLPQESVTERRYGFAAVKCVACQTGYALGSGFAQEFQSFSAKPEPRAQPDH